MARQIIDIGIQGNDGTGDSIRESFRKVNENFQQIFSVFGSGETITLSDLDDTPDSYQASNSIQASILVADDTGSFLVSKVLVGGEGVIIDNTDPNQTTIIATNRGLITDSSPTLSNHLNANGFGIAQIREPSEDLVALYNNVYNTNASEDDFVINRGYADRRYLQSSGASRGAGAGGNQIRVRFEPSDSSEYFNLIENWIGGYAVLVDHGFNTSINGAPFIYTNSGNIPATGLIKDQTYYLRYIDASRLGVYSTFEDAVANTNRIQVNLDPEINDINRGAENLVDAFYNPSLPGNWLSNEALPRVSTVRRQGDSMEGLLFLSDHPGELAGVGTPNGADDLQAATKYYVDSVSYTSNVNLFVSTTGTDLQPNTPTENQGRANSYAFATIGRACLKAEELINRSLIEPGPYRQRLTYATGVEATLNSFDINIANKRTLKVFTNGVGVDQTIDPDNRDLREGSIIKGLYSGATSVVTKYNGLVGDDAVYVVDLLHKITDLTVFEANYVISSTKLDTNRSFIQAEVVEFVNTKYPGVIFDANILSRDIGFLVDALSLDIKFGGNRHTLDIARAFDKGEPSVLLLGQIEETLDAIDYSYRVIEKILQNNLILDYNPPPFGVNTPNDVSRRSALLQDISGNPGEVASLNLIRSLVDTVLDVVENGPISETYLEFLLDEPLEYGQPVPELQISIFVESGIYYEQLPIRVPSNVSIKGDEFRRSIVRPAPGESLSPWVRQYFFRNDVFDGLTRTYTSSPGVVATLNTETNNWEISVASTAGLQVGMYLKIVSGPGEFDELTQVKELINSTTFIITVAPSDNLFDSSTVIRGLNSSNLAPIGEPFAYHYLIDPSSSDSRPKQNKDLDMFLLNDGTILRNITAQGHGGFMCVLDPTGSIQTKSPYFQTATSLSGSIDAQRFAGGMLIDGFSGNLEATISSKDSDTQLQLSGLVRRRPITPCSFFITGVRYQINVIDNYNPTAGTATITLDEATPYPFEVTVEIPIVIDTPGNRSMLANDFTQINDLGYGCIALNNGLAELVSVFSYYNWTSYYSVNGGQIRSVTGNSSYGEFGLRANGRDPNEVPDEVILADSVLQQAKIYKRGSLSTKSVAGESAFYIDNYWHMPTGTSEAEIDHTPKKSSLIEDSLSIVSGGLGYQLDDVLAADGGVIEIGKNTSIFVVTEIDNGNIGGPGIITGIEIADTGSYISTDPTTFTSSPVGIWPITAGTFISSGGSGSGATFSGSFLGNRSIYEITTIESTISTGTGFDNTGTPITKPVLKLNLDIASASSGTQPALFSDLFDGQIVSIRSLQKLRFEGIDEIKPVRPSTALEFQSVAAGDQILRTLSYELSNAVGNDLNPPLPAEQSQAILSFDSNIDYVFIDTDIDTIVTGYGLAAGDTKIAILEVTGNKLSRINSGELIFFHQGRGHQITSYSPAGTDGPGTPGHISFTDLPLGQGTIVAGVGLVEGITNVRNTTIRAGVNAGTPAFITVRISTCRATAHDFLDVGSGGYNDTNYPNNLYGAPANDPQKEKEVVEETQGRVFYVSTDQNGIFKVGRFFEVDQGTGNVTFNAPITLTDLNGIGFKKGTFVTEFSTDNSLQDNDSNTVPTESAVRGYIDRRLGVSHEGNIIPDVQRIGAGYLYLDGSLGMSGNLNMAGPNSAPVPHKIINLAPPSDDSDATTKQYVDSEIAKYDTLKELKDITLIDHQSGDLILFNPNTTQLTNARMSGEVDVTVDFSRPYAGTLQGGITIFPNIDAGIVGTSNVSVSGGIVINENITSWPFSGYIQINNEIFRYSNKTDASRRLEGILRGEFATSVATHSTGATVEYLSTTEVEVLIGLEVITNKNVSNTAAISQSKLDLEIATTRASAPTGTAENIQSSSGVASFDSSNFEITNGFVGIKSGGIGLPEIQDIAAGSIIGNLTASAAAPQEVTTSGIVENGVTTLFATVDEGSSSVLSRRVNGLNSTALTNRVGLSITGSGSYAGVPGYTIPATGTGFGAKFTISYNGGVYTNAIATYGGTNYQAGTQIKISGELLGGTDGVEDLTIVVGSENIDNNTYYSFQRTTTTAEANSIVRTDSNRNLGSAGNRFNNIFANSMNVEGLLYYSLDNNVTATGATQVNATQLSKNVNNIVAGAGGGVITPVATILGQRIIIRNETLGDVRVYPTVGTRINSLAVNVAYILPSDATLEFIYLGVTSGSSPSGQWVTPNATLL